MNSRIDQRKDPDRRPHVANARPHAHHGTRVVIGLQRRALLALGQDNRGVQDLIEFGQIEDPAKVGQPLVPQPPIVRRVGHASGSQLGFRVGQNPFVGGRVVHGAVSQPPGARYLAQRIDDCNELVGIIPAGHRVAERLEHACKGPCRVHGQENIVQDDEGLEESRAADGPWLITPALVHAIQEDHGRRVDAGDGDWDPDIEQLGVQLGRDWEWLRPGALCLGSRKRRGPRIGREFEQRRWRKAELQGRARLTGV